MHMQISITGEDMAEYLQDRMVSGNLWRTFHEVDRIIIPLSEDESECLEIMWVQDTEEVVVVKHPEEEAVYSIICGDMIPATLEEIQAAKHARITSARIPPVVPIQEGS